MTKLSLSGRLTSGAIVLLVLVGLLAGAISFNASSGAHAAGTSSSQAVPSNSVSARPQYLYAGKQLSSGQFTCQLPGASFECRASAWLMSSRMQSI